MSTGPQWAHVEPWVVGVIEPVKGLTTYSAIRPALNSVAYRNLGGARLIAEIVAFTVVLPTPPHLSQACTTVLYEPFGRLIFVFNLFALMVYAFTPGAV